MEQLLSSQLPGLAEAARVADSRAGEGLGLFARRAFEEGDEIFRWESASTIMEPSKRISEKLYAADYGALAFQALKAARSPDASPWKTWLETGVAAPATHPLKLLFSDPAAAQRFWRSTTCGGRMSASASDLRNDVELLGGSADLEEWAEMMALVMSRSIVQDRAGRPLLVMGADLLQDGEDPNVELELIYETVGASSGLFGVGGGVGGVTTLKGVLMRANQPIVQGEELTTHYLPKPHGGGYLELYGFLPGRLKGVFGESCVELVFAPTDWEEDGSYGEKENALQDVGLSPDSMAFYFANSDIISVVNPDDDPWDSKAEIDRMATILRMRHVGGADSFLLDAVYLDFLWENCNFRISKANETKVCEVVLEECDRWLERFEELDKELGLLPSGEGRDAEAAAAKVDVDAQKDGPASWANDVRKGEQQLLLRVRSVFAQEAKDTLFDEGRAYWADRQMKKVFPRRANIARDGSRVDMYDITDPANSIL